MTTTTRTSRRIGNFAIRLAAVFAFALLFAGTFAPHAGAEANNGVAMDKGAFKTGCEAGGGSFVDNADGSFQCNLRSGGTIKCANTTSPCTYSALVISGGNSKGAIRVNSVGALQIEQATPTPTKVANTAVSKASVKSATAP